MAEATPQKVIDTLTAPIVRALDDQGITISYLARKLKSELLAKEVKVFYDKDLGKVVYSDHLVAWDTRQKARVDAHALRGDYPPEKKEISGRNGGPIKVIIEDLGTKKGNPVPGGPAAADPRDDLAPAEKDMIDG
jgi:hypothetical protein